MIRLLIILLLAVGMTPSVEALKHIPPKTLQPSKVEQELLQAERAVIDASVGRDSRALERLLSEDYVLITEDGEVTNDSTREFLRNYMAEFHQFVARVYTALPRGE